MTLYQHCAVQYDHFVEPSDHRDAGYYSKYWVQELNRAVGQRVIVARGRKVPHGTTGIVQRVSSKRFGTNVTHSAMVDGRWIYFQNLDVVA